MLNKITVGRGWRKYKSEVFVPLGDYYEFLGKPNDIQKAQLGLIACTDPNGRFKRLAPFAKWVKCAMNGVWVPESLCYGKPEPEDMDWSIIGIDPSVLRPYQRKWVVDAWNTLASGQQYRRAAIVGLGGGKTLMALALSGMVDTTVVLAPRHIHSTWREEAAKWGFKEPVISTYESAHRCPKPDLLVLDESNQVKNPDALRSGHARALSEDASIVVALTGTPTGGGGVFDWRFLDVVSPGSIPLGEKPWRFLFSKETTVKEVAQGRKSYVTPTDSWDTQSIANFVAPYVYRVDTASLLEHLPPVQFRKVWVPQPKEWSLVQAGATTEMSASKRVTQARTLSDGFIYADDGTAIRLDNAKVNAIVDLVDGLGEPVVVVARWRESITELAKALSRFNPAVVAGDTLDMGHEIDRFKAGETDVLILGAGHGTGINGLQDRCRICICMSWSANPLMREQLIGRFHRFGQSSGVVVIDVLAESSLDEKCLELISSHRDLSESMVKKILAESL
jgi:hypothetical protein